MTLDNWPAKRARTSATLLILEDSPTQVFRVKR